MSAKATWARYIWKVAFQLKRGLNLSAAGIQCGAWIAATEMRKDGNADGY